MRRSSFAEASLEDGARALNRAFENYLVPFEFTAEQLRLHIAYNDVDPAASPIWYDDGGAVVAAAVLGIRGARGWVGGFGVAPPYRGQGHARTLIAALEQTARERGLHSLQLEVLAENAPAIHLYRTAGFERTRSLQSLRFAVREVPEAAGYREVSPQAFIDAPDETPPCWQREAASLRAGAVSSALVLENGAYALFRHNGRSAQLFKLHAPDAPALSGLACAIAAATGAESLLVLNEPEESSICRHAKTARWDEPFVQDEMVLVLENSVRKPRR